MGMYYLSILLLVLIYYTIILSFATMTRAFCIPGVVLLGCALVLSFLVSVSLPYLPALDITRAHFNSTVKQDGTTGVQELRVPFFAIINLFINSDKFPQLGIW